MIPTPEEKKRRKLFQELVDAGFHYMRMHNDPDNEGSAYKKTVSKKRFLRAIDAMNDFLEPAKILKMKPRILSAHKGSSHITTITP